MAKRDDRTLSLDKVSARFLQAEQELRTLVTAREGLKAESQQLAKAQAPVRQIGSKGVDLPVAAERMLNEVREAVEVIRERDPGAIAERLGALDEKLVSAGERLASVEDESLRGDVHQARAVGKVAAALAALAGLLAGMGLVIQARPGCGRGCCASDDGLHSILGGDRRFQPRSGVRRTVNLDPFAR